MSFAVRAEWVFNAGNLEKGTKFNKNVKKDKKYFAKSGGYAIFAI